MCGWCNPDAYGYGDTDTGIPNAYAYSYGDRNGNDASANAYADTLGDPASANAKTAAHTVPSADAVSEWIKELKELKSNRELARQLASSLLFRGDIIRSRFGLRAIRATTTEPRRRRVVKKLSQKIVKKRVLTGLRFSD